MPMYEYECSAHGVFESITVMARSAEPAPCPDCSASSTRVLSPTRISGMARSNYVAHERNERSRHEPRMASKPTSDANAPPRRPALQASHSSRPWCLEHG